MQNHGFYVEIFGVTATVGVAVAEGPVVTVSMAGFTTVRSKILISIRSFMRFLRGRGLKTPQAPDFIELGTTLFAVYPRFFNFKPLFHIFSPKRRSSKSEKVAAKAKFYLATLTGQKLPNYVILIPNLQRATRTRVE